jgi:hypothetical protein
VTESHVLPAATAFEALARRFHEYEFGDPLDGLADLVHPEARMSFLRHGLGPLEGRAAIVAEVTQSREARFYRATVSGFEWIDEWTLLVTGRARYVWSESGGITDSRVWWVDEFLEGMLWRIDVFTSERSLDERLTVKQ